ncbi:UTP--glucose-1-phosphate uridylyltransferase, partial [Neobacillus vireti]|uniref:UTP--glucose-1-phosphate uridylyltransferase n=1 Tax=Neobacillus vireti TaxID=220686 RepID=UPI0030008B38
QYIVEEAVASGIEEIIIITGRGKRSIEDHFDKSYELEDTLLKKNNLAMLKEIQSISNLANIYYVRQKDPNGLGDAILCAKEIVGNEPFAVLLGDDVVTSRVPCLKQLLQVFEYYNSSVVGIQEVPEQEVSKYGIIKPRGVLREPDLFAIDSLVEKPNRKDAPSRYAVMGRYVLVPEIFTILEQLPVGQGNELQLTDALNELNNQKAVLAYNFEGTRYDIGSKIGHLKATIDFALTRPEIREEVINHLEEIVKGCQAP